MVSLKICFGVSSGFLKGFLKVAFRVSLGFHLWFHSRFYLGRCGVSLKVSCSCIFEICPHRRCSRREHPDGINNCKVHVYLGESIFPKPCVFRGSRHRTSKNIVFYSTKWTCSCTRPPGTGKTKVKNTCVFSLLVVDFFLFWNVFFFRCVLSGGRGSNFCDLEALWGMFFAVFAGQKCWFLQCFCTLPKLDSFARNWKKNLTNSGVFGHGQLKNIAICSGFCLAERKNIVKNTVNSAVFGNLTLKNTVS